VQPQDTYFRLLPAIARAYLANQRVNLHPSC
jgi:hypothetical protein